MGRLYQNKYRAKLSSLTGSSFVFFSVPIKIDTNSISNISSENEIYFSWTGIPCGSRNGELTGYTYILRQGNSATVVTGPTSITVTTSVAITGLSCDTTYRFYVAGENSEGQGAYSDPTTATTLCCTRGIVERLSGILHCYNNYALAERSMH